VSGQTRYIYHLVDAGDVTQYVGCSVNPYRRLIGHLSEARIHSANSSRPWTYRFYQWLWMEWSATRPVSVRIVAIAREDWREHEQEEIISAACDGHPVQNTCVKGWRRIARSETAIMLRRPRLGVTLDSLRAKRRTR
jgi:hypothetical protein